MASPRLVKSLTNLKRRRRADVLAKRSDQKRRLHLESLEDRRLMAQGPSLVSVIPNNGVFLKNNDILNVAPREITFRFAQGNSIDPATLSTGIRVVRAGADGVIDPVGDPTPDDVAVPLGFIGLGDTPREVIMRFAGNLPDDAYQVTLIGTGITPLKDTSGNPFTVNGVAADQSIAFRLDLGAKVEAIVPQPITRVTGNVQQQSSNTIDVYFDQTLNGDGR